MAIDPLSGMDPPPRPPLRRPDEPLRDDGPLDSPANDEFGIPEDLKERSPSFWVPIAIAVLLLIGAVAFVMGHTASAQAPKAATDEKQCADQFKAADINNDGVLSSTEIGNAKGKLPASLEGKDKVSRTDFLAVCGKRAS